MDDNAPGTTASENVLLGGYEPTQSAAPAESEGQAPENTAPVEEQSTDWLSGFDEDTQGYIANKAWKSPNDMLQSYQNLEKLKGAPGDQLYQIHESMSDEDRGKVFDAMGRPMAADKYSIEVGEDHIPEVADWFKNTAHEMGLSDKQATAIYNGFNETVTQYASGLNEQKIQAHQQAVEGLQKEWGAGFEAEVNRAERAAQQIGLDNETLATLRDSGAAVPLIKALAKVGDMMGEGQMKGLSPTESKAMIGGFTPQQAKVEVESKRNDPEFMARYTKGDPKATKEMEDLYKCMVK